MKKLQMITACFLAALFLLTAVSCGTVAGSPMTLMSAIYPTMAKYPNERSLTFEKDHAAWSASRKAQRDYSGSGKNLDGFFTESTKEFLSGAGTENRVYSPLNVYMALAMLAELTDGESRAQILSLLNAQSIEALRTQAHAIWNANYCDDGAVTSVLASSLWMDQDFVAHEEVLKTLADTFYASSFSGKMGSAELNKLFHAWLNEQTGGLLKDQVDALNLTPDVLIALATTIYFRAKWSSSFSKSKTAPATFHSATGDRTVDFMHRTETYGIYYWGEKFAATSLSLEASGGTMWFILPDEGVTAEELLSDYAAMSFLTSGTKQCESKMLRVNLSVPKFDVNSKLDLVGGLQALGVTDCFAADHADFSPLTGRRDVFVSKVEHGARVAIDEEGVTAAAYTVLMMAGAMMPPEEEVDFTLDRPFLFVLTSADGLPLFTGIVNQIS